MTDAATLPVLAAGAVCWRRRASSVEVLLISRPRHGDVSLPKGKIDLGESLDAVEGRHNRRRVQHCRIYDSQPELAFRPAGPGAREVRSEVALEFLLRKRAGMTKEASALAADHDCPPSRRVATRSRQRDWDRVAENGVVA